MTKWFFWVQVENSALRDQVTLLEAAASQAAADGGRSGDGGGAGGMALGLAQAEVSKLTQEVSSLTSHFSL